MNLIPQVGNIISCLAICLFSAEYHGTQTHSLHLTLSMLGTSLNVSPNSVDPDQTALLEQSDQALHCLPRM